MTRSVGSVLILAVLVLAGSTIASAATVVITPTKDNSFFANLPGNSSGQGPCVFSGGSGVGARRAVVAFDVAGSVPAGSTITSVTLDMLITNSGSFATATDVYRLHRLTADWGEDASNSGCGFPGGGQGTPGLPGDATWSHRFIGLGMPWASPGGDFNPTPSGAVQLPLIGPATWASFAGMVADAQLWLDVPAGNFGWILIGNEATPRSARRFDSREGTSPPSLTIEFTPASGGPPPAVPDGVAGPPLLVEKLATDGSSLSVQFDTGLCTDNADHNLVFAGGSGLPSALGGGYLPLGSDCTFGAASPATWLGVPDPAVSDPATRFVWFLVLANDGATIEGSWGLHSGGGERTGPGLNGSSAQCAIADKNLTNSCGN